MVGTSCKSLPGRRKFFKLCIEQMKEKDEEHFHLATRMSVSHFNMLLNLIRPNLEKNLCENP